MLVSLGITGLLLIVMPVLLYLTAYLAKRYTTDRPLRLKSASRNLVQRGPKPIYGEYTRKPGKPVYIEPA